MPLTNNERQHNYWEKHSEEIKEKRKEQIKCECGALITKHSLYKHRKSKAHLLATKQIKYEFINDDDEDSEEK